VEIPIIADADDGYGNALSAMRTSLERTKAGHPTESHHVMARVRHFQELERKYILGAAARIQSPDGFGEAAQGTERGVMTAVLARLITTENGKPFEEARSRTSGGLPSRPGASPASGCRRRTPASARGCCASPSGRSPRSRPGTSRPRWSPARSRRPRQPGAASCGHPLTDGVWSRGFFCVPTVLLDATEEMAVAREETRPTPRPTASAPTCTHVTSEER